MDWIQVEQGVLLVKIGVRLSAERVDGGVA
jgi:hypothetical protein